MASQTVVARLIATLGIDSKQFETGIKRTERQLRSTGRSLTTGLTLPVAAAGFGIIKLAADFDKSIRRVNALTGATSDQFDRLRKKALELGRTTAFTARQTAEGMGFLAQAGFDANQIYATTGKVLDLAAAGAVELSRAADIATNVLQAFGLATSEAKGEQAQMLEVERNLTRVTDVLAKTFSRTNVNLEQLADAMKLAAPTANTLGLEVEEVASAIGFMGNAGIQGTLAGTALNQMLISMAALAPSAEEALKGLGEKTFSFADAAGRLRPLVDILDDINNLELEGTALAELSDTLFGRRGARASLTLGPAAKELRQFQQDVNEFGFAAAVALKQLEGLNGALLKFKSAVESAALKVASSGLEDALVSFLNLTTTAIREIPQMNDALIRQVTTWALIAAAIGPVLLGFASLAALFSLLTVGGFGAAAAVTALGVGLLTLAGSEALDFFERFAARAERAKEAVNRLDDAAHDLKLNPREQVEAADAAIKQIQAQIEAQKESIRIAKEQQVLSTASQTGRFAAFGQLGVGGNKIDSKELQAQVDAAEEGLAQLETILASLDIKAEGLDAVALGLENMAKAADRIEVERKAKELSDFEQSIVDIGTALEKALEFEEVFQEIFGTTEIERLENEIKATEKAFSSYVDQLGNLSPKALETAKHLATLRKELGLITDEADAFEEVNKQLEAEEKLLEELNLELGGTDAILEKAVNDFRDLAISAGLFGDKLENVVAQFEEFKQGQIAIEAAQANMEELRKVFDNFVEDFQRSLASAIEGALGSGVNSFKDFGQNILDFFRRTLSQLLSKTITGALTTGVNALLGGGSGGGASSSRSFLGGILGAAGAGGAGGSGGLGNIIDSLSGVLSGTKDFLGGLFGAGGTATAPTGSFGAALIGQGLSGAQIAAGQGTSGAIKAATAGVTGSGGGGLSEGQVAGIIGAVTSVVDGIVSGIDAKKNAIKQVGLRAADTVADGTTLLISNIVTGIGIAVISYFTLGLGSILGGLDLGNTFAKFGNNAFARADTGDLLAFTALLAIDPILALIVGGTGGKFDKFKADVNAVTAPTPTASFFDRPNQATEGPFGFVGAGNSSRRLNTEFRESFADFIADFDESVASLLRPEDIERVAGGLQDISASNRVQVFSFTEFDNEVAQVLGNRIFQIMRSLGVDPNEFIPQFQRKNQGQFANIKEEDLPAFTGGFQDFIALREEIFKLRDELLGFNEVTNAAEDAIATVVQAFAVLVQEAPKVGVVLGDIDHVLEAALQNLTDTFDEGVQDLILSLTDPLQSELNVLAAAQAIRLAEAETFGADLVEVERLAQLERLALLEQFLGQGTQAMEDVIENIRGGAGTASPFDTLGAAEAKFDELLTLAQGGDVDAFNAVAGAANALIEASRNVFGSTAGFAERTEFIALALENLLASRGDIFAPGFATGGSFMVGGSGGIDSQGFGSFSATPGEIVSIRRGNTQDQILREIGAEIVRGNADQFVQMSELNERVETLASAQSETASELESLNLQQATVRAAS